MKRAKHYFSILLPICLSLTVSARETADSLATDTVAVDFSQLEAVTDSLMKNYRFREAADLFTAAKAGADSLDALRIDEEMIQAQNGSNMTGFCSNPIPVARQRFSLKDFFLYYPLQDKSWRPVPNQLDSTAGDPFARATYVPSDSKALYWSAKDSDGIRNIYSSDFRDTVWSAPALVNEQMTSSSDEIYPMVSPDGKQLFFASKGLYGMGGYDLYVSTWDDSLKDWGMPVNMGFPYSSPYDDFLFINTSDGKYSLFASNRACPADSVDIYVLEFDSTPVRRQVDDPEELKALCRLDPVNDPARMDNGSAVADDVQDNADMRRYSEKLVQVRSLRDSIYKLGTVQDPDGLALLPALRDSLTKASKELQQIELGFLKSGITIDPEKLQKEADREVVGATSGYTFSRKSLGNPLRLDMEKPKKSFDYTFQILPQGRFAEDNTLPGGLVYQIQLFSMTAKATVKQIKGLSPVFERNGSNGRRIYSAGVFRSYKDVLANLNKVKRIGFRSAIIVAFIDGKPVTIQKARATEKSIHELFQIRLFPSDGQSLGSAELAAVKEASDTDMARTAEGGVISYLLGPFDSREAAESVAGTLRNAGLTNLRIESAGMSAAE